MYSFHILFIYILFFILKKIKSRKESIKKWENNTIHKQIHFNSNDIKILSYTSDDESGAELYFVEEQEKYYFYFGNVNDDNVFKIEKENEKLIEFQSPLFKNNSKYYFCTSQNIMYFNGSSIIELKNPSQLNNLKYSLKCLRGPNKSIVASFLNTKYLSFIYPKDNEISTHEQYLGDYIAINNYIQEKEQTNVFRLTTIIRNGDSNYYIATIKKDGSSDPLVEQQSQAINNMELFSSVEISTYFTGQTYSFIFTYVKNTDKFHIYRHDLKNNKFFEFRFFYVFKNFNITFAKYFNDSCILYYSITSIVPDVNQKYKSYIGVIDIEYNLGLYNIESDYKGKIYFNFGSKNKKDINLIYFKNDTKLSNCPFVNQNNACLNEFENNRFVVSKNNDGVYYNYFSEECPYSFTGFGNYCYENCTDGFYIDNAHGNKCTFCEVDEQINRLFFYISKECLDPKECKDANGKLYFRDTSTCYDCERAGKIYHDNDCIDDCAEIFAEEDKTNSSNCIKCEDKDPDSDVKYYFSLKEKKCTLCENGVKDNNKNLCSECKYNSDNNNYYFKPLDQCIDSCKRYYSKVDTDWNCTFCENNFYYEEGKCIENSCQLPGYGKEEITLELPNENKKLNICIFCKNNTANPSNIFLQNKSCTNTCGGEFKKIGQDNICVNCKDNNSYYFIDTQDCTNECPDKAIANDDDMTCGFCPDGQFFSDSDPKHKQCLQKCKENQEAKSGILDNIKYNYCYDLEKCEENLIFINGSCQNCSGQFYSPSSSSCYKCFCWNEKDNEEYHCNQTNGQCFCPDKYYGYSCEFYFEEGNEEM